MSGYWDVNHGGGSDGGNLRTCGGTSGGKNGGAYNGG